MIYLDYSATTPVLDEVLDSYNKASLKYIGNSNSIHSLGVESRKLLNSALKQIGDLLGVKDDEVIITSGATESNNTAIKGIALANQKRGKHIIISKLEHPSIYDICDFLKDNGFEVSEVDNNKDGLIDLDSLKKILRKDTILVSICAVNSETGIKQDLSSIKKVIKDYNKRIVFHSDMTQALGKIRINLNDVDMASMSSHKIYGPKGIGVLYKKKNINIIPLIHGSSNIYRGGTPALPLIVAFSKALRLSLNEIDNKYNKILKMNEVLKKELKLLDIDINSNENSIPHILNISLKKSIKPETFVHALEKHNIFISTNTACSSNDVSSSVLAIFDDIKRASRALRISISYLTTDDEIKEFISVFKKIYNDLDF